MADSDITTTLPHVTRGSVAAGTATAKVRRQAQAFTPGDSKTDQSTDPAVVAWREWHSAHEETARLCRQQQRLERKLVETVGFPSATILSRDGESVTLHSLQAIHEMIDRGPAAMATRGKIEAEFAAHQARWDDADREIGYSAKMRAESEAADRAEELLKTLSETPATSLAGVAAKLDAVLREGEPSDDDDEFPWPHIQSALSDVIRMGQKLVPRQMLSSRKGASKRQRRKD